MGWVLDTAIISLNLSEDLDAQLTELAHRRRLSKSELVRRALTAFLQSSRQGVDGSAPQSAGDLLADLVGCCKTGPADLLSNPVHLLLQRSGFDPALALQFIERGVVQLPFVLLEQDSTG